MPALLCLLTKETIVTKTEMPNPPPSRTIQPVVWVVAAGVLLFVFGCAGLVLWTPLGEPLRALGQREAPDFELESLDGRILRLADYRGQVVLLNFWSTTCPPCREELPEIERLHRAHARSGLAVVAVSVSGRASTVRDYISPRGLTFSIGLDSDLTVARSYKVGAIPHTVLIDRAGMIRHQHVGYGPESFAKMEGRLVELLQEEAP